MGLDLNPSPNGLAVSIAAVGEKSLLTAKRRLAAKSMDLICISDNLGAAFLGLQVLEREKRAFEKSGDVNIDLCSQAAVSDKSLNSITKTPCDEITI